MTGTIYHIKLVNQEEILAELLPSTNKDEYRIKNPLLVQDVVDRLSGTTAIVLIDYVPFTSDKSSVFLNRNLVISKMPVDVDMKAYYDASLSYAEMYGNRDTTTKIKAAAEKLAKYMTALTGPQTTEFSSGIIDDSLSVEDIEDLDEEDVDLDEIFGTIEPTANTTIH